MASPYGMNYGIPVGRAVTRRLGGKWTPAKATFFDAWAQAEGTKASYNPFATTRRGFPGETQFNSAGVKNYPDLATGIDATVSTIQLAYYTELANLLRRDDVTAKQLAEAVAASPWGTGAGVLRVLGITQSDGYERAQATAGYGARKGAIEQSYRTITLDRFRPSEAYVNALSNDPAMEPILGAIENYKPFTIRERVETPAPTEHGQGATVPYTPSGEGFIQLPTSWKGTHPTSGLGWGTRTAEDIMGAPGTGVGAPEDAVVVYYHPTGAQGGGSMLLRTKNGREYWIGHIANGVKAGTRVKAGQRIADISADHPAPHVHIDYRGKRKGK